MKFPSKIIPYHQSILALFPIILNLLEENEQSPLELYQKTKKTSKMLRNFQKY